MLRWAILRSVTRRSLDARRNFIGSVPDYYLLLGVKKDATQREIKSAYYSLSKKYHPDVAGTSQDASTRFLQISEAYECLRDPQKRRAYDNQSTGGGGRYPGDNGGPFKAYQDRDWSYQKTYGNPFHNRQFTEAEYRRIWEEFERLKNQQQHSKEFQWRAFEREQLWSNLRRAQRWQQFHKQYPDGAPGSFRWEFKWGPQNQAQHQNNVNQAYRGWNLFRRIMMVYFLCFFVVSVVQVMFRSIGNSSTISPQKAAVKMGNEESSDRKKLDEMMGRVPGGPSLPSYMTTPPMSSSEPNKKSSEFSNVSDLEFQMYQPAPVDTHFR